MKAVPLVIAMSLAIVLNLQPAKADEKQPFDGTWMWRKGPEELTLRLRQSGNHIVGTHLAIGQDGNKVDENDHIDRPSIVGESKDDHAEVTFKSGYPDSQGGGIAEIDKKGKVLKWHIMRSTGENYFPSNAILHKK